ncbi:RNA-guided endonuclease TnpB family protein [Ureibacillus chungkukjangi]|uniref:RNA-guided endonuclease InsQ/TnpB family protein n=1 Tax=Ureibacillus chungkukjangi TaxID=1202712 RepID=UPI002040EE8A|nr:RNA-guided endonuclease TnpB family protein [Ureibacillus chungkukjangi]MCM3387188.1 RNA-guided endonuclease TnpB family protein [Ureibacillus chungkukjangi]
MAKKENKIKTMTKTMRCEIKYNKEIYKLLGDIQYEVYLLKNKATTLSYDWQNFSFSYSERFGQYPNSKELTGQVWISGDINNVLKEEHAKSVYSMTRETAVKEAVDKFKNDTPEIMKGNISIARYKRDGSFPIRAKQITNLIKQNSKLYTSKLALLSREGAKERGLKNGQIDVELKTGNGSNVILDRLISGEYKLSDSKIGKVKNKFYLLVAYTFTPEKVELDENKVMGVDVGVNVPATLGVNFDKYYRQFVGNGKEIADFENQVVARKKRIQESRKWAGKGSVGHGIKTRTKAVDKISGKIANFKQTKNHNWSRYIVDEAVKMGCGVIQMEDLSGISEENTFLKTWTYYQLQQYITYKAEEKGIKVIKVDPKYTSARCNKCGHIHIGNKDNWRPNQETFHCQNCNHKVNADVNAARNIAMKDIENIIKQQLKVQEKHSKHAMKYLV